MFSVSLSFTHSIALTICLSVSLSIYLSIYLSTSPHLSISPLSFSVSFAVNNKHMHGPSQLRPIHNYCTKEGLKITLWRVCIIIDVRSLSGQLVSVNPLLHGQPPNKFGYKKPETYSWWSWKWLEGVVLSSEVMPQIFSHSLSCYDIFICTILESLFLNKP